MFLSVGTLIKKERLN